MSPPVSARDHRSGPTTPRLHLRALTPADAEAFFALNSHSEVMRYTCEEPLHSIEEARRAIENYPDFDKSRGGPGFGRWGCILRSTNTVIGFCGLKRLSDLPGSEPGEEKGCIDVGYRLLPDYWNRGLATEACAASIAYGFGVLNLPRIIALVLEANAPSIRVLEKCGLCNVGTIEYQGQRPLLFEIRR